MKHVNDIPVRRRPQSKDVHPGDAVPEDNGMRARRQIWELEPDMAPETQENAPAPEPARPRSTPLILTQSARDVPAEAAPEMSAPKRRAEAGTMPSPPPEPGSPVPPPPRPPAPPEPLQNQPHPVSRPVSRPRVAEPETDTTQARPAAAPAAPAQPSSMRQRSRPIKTHPADEAAQAAPPPPPPQAGGVNRVKTRILGFHAQDTAADPMAAASAVATAASQGGYFPTGWLVIVDGPGRGASFSVAAGVSTIGRGEDQAISLDFGDQSVSRSAHASVAYDEEQRKFYIGHGGKSNVVRRNSAPVLATEELEDGDLIRIGKTTLRFVAFCNAEFSWGAEGDHG